MNDSSSSSKDIDDRSWLEKIGSLFSSDPKSLSELQDTLTTAADNHIIDQDAVEIFKGAITVADKQVRDIMVPRAQMVVLRSNATIEEILPVVIESSHSRFPVVGETTDQLMGILLAKDLLPFVLKDAEEGFNLENVLRPVEVVPETKRLNVLLREFRENRKHMVVVIDEFGDVAGLVTIEDVLEEIVGEIEDEYDTDVERLIRPIGKNDYIVKAITTIEELNETLKIELPREEFDTIGGLVAHQFGHLPGRNEQTTVENLDCIVLRADNRRIQLLRIKVNT